MKKYNFNQKDLEMMSYQDIAKEILIVEKKAMNTFEIFTIISNVLNFTEAQFEKRIEDFFATLTTDKNFIMLEDGSWDLKRNHKAKKIIEDDEEEIDDDDEKDELQNQSNNDDDDIINYDNVELDDDDSILTDDDDLDQLTTLTEDELLNQED